MVANASNHLTALGHTVTFAGSTLADYSSFDQVWDLRYNVNLTATDVTNMGNFLAGGGRMYMTGEHANFDSSRNTSLVSFLNGIGAGSVSLSGGVGIASQVITADGQAVNAPNIFSSVSFNAARTTASPGDGFLVTETAAGSGVGSLVGWDFGDITGNPDARLLVGFDIEIFANGQDWTENMATYLAADAPAVGAPVPLPAAAWSGLALMGMVVGIRAWRRRATA